ncbi:DUF2267 domain-containing protein [Amycolatopsis coloradensis]|uniref:DUF2267 domain-containing protein n=1 Tax=Amycolatopsis coloradensis TaxID=76021 RepID=A0ACD5BHI9_9PSEU
MRHDEFIGQVQNRAKLSDRGEAAGVTRATLETLGERIPEPLAANLACERFGHDEFIRRVAQRGHTDGPQATYRSRVVLEVVGEATTGGSMDKIRESLPDDLRVLVDAGSSGALE